MNKKKRNPLGTLEINMTAMCDVIFQLLIYLILTAKAPLVLADLSVDRPQEEKNRIIDEFTSVEIGVFEDAYTIGDRRVRKDALNNVMKSLAEANKNQRLIIKCAGDSIHDKLVYLLDICAREGLTRISVMSM